MPRSLSSSSQASNNAVPFTLNERNVVVALNDMPLIATINVSVREYYTLTYLVQGKEYEAFKVAQGENAVIPTANPSVTGYSFDAWFVGQEVVTAQTVLPLTSDNYAEVISVNAHLTPIIYSASLAVDEAFASMANATVTTGYFTIESDLGAFTVPTLTGTYVNDYQFAGWFYKGKLITKGSDLPSANGEVVYACYSKKHYTITYKNGNDIMVCLLAK